MQFKDLKLKYGGKIFYPECCIGCKFEEYSPKRYPCGLCKWDKDKQQGTRFVKC